MKIEEAIKAQLVTYAAITAAGCPVGSIRADELMQTDASPGITIEVVEETFDNDISGTTSLAGAKVIVSASSGNKAQARAIADAIQTNGTDPGTGLAGCTVLTGALPFQAMLPRRTFDRIPIPNGGNTSRYIVDSLYTLTFNQTT